MHRTAKSYAILPASEISLYTKQKAAIAKGTQCDKLLMKRFAWNSEKNAQLIQERGISFERVIYHIERDEILDVIEHPNSFKYPNQRMFILDIGNYAYLVPFVETDTEFLGLCHIE